MDVYFEVFQACAAEYTLEPLVCPYCRVIGETTYNSAANDYYCAFCGKWAESGEEQ